MIGVGLVSSVYASFARFKRAGLLCGRRRALTVYLHSIQTSKRFGGGSGGASSLSRKGVEYIFSSGGSVLGRCWIGIGLIGVNERVPQAVALVAWSPSMRTNVSVVVVVGGGGVISSALGRQGWGRPGYTPGSIPTQETRG